MGGTVLEVKAGRQITPSDIMVGCVWLGCALSLEIRRRAGSYSDLCYAVQWTPWAARLCEQGPRPGKHGDLSGDLTALGLRILGCGTRNPARL